MEESEQPSDPIEAQPPMSKAEVAEAVFRKAEAEYPELPTAKAISIAIECIRLGYDPLEIGLALKTDKKRLDSLSKSINSDNYKLKIAVESGAKKKPWQKKESLPEVDYTSEDLAEAVDYEFGFAADVMGSPPEELKIVLKLYPDYIKPGKIDERNYHELAKSRLTGPRRKE